MLAAAIISGLFALAGTVASGVAQNSENEKARKEQKSLALIARGDELSAQNKSFSLKKEELGIARTAQSYKQQSDKKLLRQQQLLNLGASLDNITKKDANQTNFILSLYGKNTYNAKGIGA